MEISVSFEFVKCKEPFFHLFFLFLKKKKKKKKVKYGNPYRREGSSKGPILANFSQFLPNWPWVGNCLGAYITAINVKVVFS